MADSGRQDYDRLIRFSQLEPGEPFFFIRGRDKVAGAAARAWAALAYKAGVPAAIVESALQHADRLDAWPTKQIPDANHLTREEQQALEYQLNRRAWNHRIAHVPTTTEILAEARGAQAVVSRDRHADRLAADLVDALGPIVEACPMAPTTDVFRRFQEALTRLQQDLHRRTGLTPAPAADPPPPALPEGEFAVSVFLPEDRP